MSHGNQDQKNDSRVDEPAGEKSLSLASPAERALAEAKARHLAQAKNEESAKIPEMAGRGGLDPVRFGDWEVKGIASDF